MSGCPKTREEALELVTWWHEIANPEAAAQGIRRYLDSPDGGVRLERMRIERLLRADFPRRPATATFPPTPESRAPCPRESQHVSTIRIFMSFDLENDRDLHDLLFEQSEAGASGFEVTACSGAGRMNDGWDARVRSRIAAVDEVIVICGEHTDSSPRMAAELKIAQEEGKSYLLVWGRRERMCKKPVGARKTDTMYSWTRDILRTQISATLRESQVPDSLKRAKESWARAKTRQPQIPRDIIGASR